MSVYKSPPTAADIIIEKEGKIVLITRGIEPHKGMNGIPGGFVELGEKVEEAAVREAKEETGLDVELTDIVGVYSDPRRDPRGPTVSVVFAAKMVGGELNGGDDAADAEWVDLKKVKDRKVFFDHDQILEDYLKWREKSGTYWSSRR